MTKTLTLLLLLVSYSACPKSQQNVDVSLPDASAADSDGGVLTDAQSSRRQDAIDRIARALQEAPLEDAVILLATRDGPPLIFRKGGGDENQIYNADSALKWVAATVLLREARNAGLTPQSILGDFPFAPTVLNGERSQTTLAQMLSFTAGWEDPPVCASFAGGFFHNCGESIIESEHTVPRRFYYGTHHMMVAGKAMLPETENYQDAFARFQAETNLFSVNSSHGSDEKPLAFETTALEYSEFLKAHLSRELLTQEDYTEMFADQIGDKAIESSPGDSIEGRWRYGFGNWVRCDDECGTQHHSAGSRGFYPWIELSDDTLGVIAHNAGFGDFVLSHDLYEVIKNDIPLALGL